MERQRRRTEPGTRAGHEAGEAKDKSLLCCLTNISEAHYTRTPKLKRWSHSYSVMVAVVVTPAADRFTTGGSRALRVIITRPPAPVPGSWRFHQRLRLSNSHLSPHSIDVHSSLITVQQQGGRCAPSRDSWWAGTTTTRCTELCGVEEEKRDMNLDVTATSG